MDRSPRQSNKRTRNGSINEDGKGRGDLWARKSADLETKSNFFKSTVVLPQHDIHRMTNSTLFDKVESKRFRSKISR